LTYICTTCKKELPASTEYFYKGVLFQASRNPNTTTISKCISCCKEYGRRYTASLIERKLTRSGKSKDDIFTKPGKIYIIGVKGSKNTPYKIGMTSGTNVKPRLADLQVSHWQELEILFESPVLSHIRTHESRLHDRYQSKKVRGEWYKISRKNIEEIQKEYSAKME
jgi:hypothetical protein